MNTYSQVCPDAENVGNRWLESTTLTRLLKLKNKKKSKKAL